MRSGEAGTGALPRELAALLEPLHEAVVVAGEDGRIAGWNAAAAALLGRPGGQAAGLPLDAVLDLAGEPWPGAGAAGQAAGFGPRQALATGPDGRRRWVEASLSRVQAGGQRMLVAVLRDAAEARRIAQERDHLAALVDSSEDAILSKDLDGTIRTWNPGAERLYGYPATEAVGRPASLIIPPDLMGQEREVLRGAAAGKAVHQLETERTTRDGQRIPVSMSAAPVRDAAGEVVGELEIERDIRDRRLAEEGQRLAEERLQRLRGVEEASRARAEMLSAASHELGTPLTALRMQVELLRSGALGPLAPPQRDAVEVLQRGVDRLAALVNDVLDVSRLQAGRLALRRRPLDLAAVAAASAEGFLEAARRRGVRVALAAPGPVPVEADPLRLGQVLDNLLANALKFTPPGGAVRVEVAAEGGEAVARVRDTGAGFTPQQAGGLFQPFRQLHEPPPGAPPGTGLGLFIARGIVQQHGGRLEASSPGPGQGATFTVVLPGARAPPPGFPEAAAAALPAGLPEGRRGEDLRRAR